MSRPLNLTIDLIGELEEKVLECVYPHVAARQLGVSRKRWDEWMRLGESGYDRAIPNTDPDYIYRVLFEKIEEAEAQAEIDLIAKIHEHADRGKSTWTAFLFVLERRFAEGWRKKEMARDVGTDFDSEMRGALERAGVTVTQAPKPPADLKAV